MKKIIIFIITFFVLLLMGLIIGCPNNYTLNDISDGIMVLSPFAIMSATAITIRADE